MELTPVGIDIAKNVFQVHYVEETTGEIVNKPIKRAKFLEFFVNRACRSRVRRFDKFSVNAVGWCS
jgi:hypothetical protein